MAANSYRCTSCALRFYGAAPGECQDCAGTAPDKTAQLSREREAARNKVASAPTKGAAKQSYDPRDPEGTGEKTTAQAVPPITPPKKPVSKRKTATKKTVAKKAATDG